jgi:hypothetical protein
VSVCALQLAGSNFPSALGNEFHKSIRGPFFLRSAEQAIYALGFASEPTGKRYAGLDAVGTYLGKGIILTGRDMVDNVMQQYHTGGVSFQLGQGRGNRALCLGLGICPLVIPFHPCGFGVWRQPQGDRFTVIDGAAECKQSIYQFGVGSLGVGVYFGIVPALHLPRRHCQQQASAKSCLHVFGTHRAGQDAGLNPTQDADSGSADMDGSTLAGLSVNSPLAGAVCL